MMNTVIHLFKALLILMVSLLFSCKAELTEEKALEQLKALPEFQAPYFAPFEVGKEMLSGDDHKNPQNYIDQHLGALIKAGLVDAKIVESNSWRSIMQLTLTGEGVKMSDPARSTENTAYVRVCNVTPVKIDTLITVTPDELIEVKYSFTQGDVTPFGSHLGFENGKTFSDTRSFVRDGTGWKIK